MHANGNEARQVLERLLGQSIESYGNVRIGDFPLRMIKSILHPTEALSTFAASSEAAILPRLMRMEESDIASGGFFLDVYGNAYVYLGLDTATCRDKDVLLALGGASAQPGTLKRTTLRDNSETSYSEFYRYK